MNKQKVLNVGVCNGRHDLPCSGFVFNKIDDPTNVDMLEREAYRYFFNNCVADNHYTRVNIYITGLTVATLAIENALTHLEQQSYLMNTDIYFMHYNRDTNSYYEQKRYSIFD